MKFTGEQETLLALLRVGLQVVHPATARPPVDRHVDWESILSMARYHGIGPFLHRTLVGNPELPVPSRVSSALEEDFMSNSALQMLHEAEMNNVLGVFRTHGLPFAFLKGLALAAQVYPEPESRLCGADIDILVKGREYPQVKAALGRIGYHPQDPRAEPHELAFIGEVEFSKRVGDRDVILDVHTDFNANSWGKVCGFDMKGIWERLACVEHDGMLLPVLPTDAILLFLAIHAAANHVFDRLILFCDLDLLIRKYERAIDWRHIAEHAALRGGKKALYHSLQYCVRLLGTPVPAAFLDSVRPGILSRRLIPAQRLLVRDREPSRSLHRYMHLALLDRPRLMIESLRFFVKRVISERAARRG